MILFQQRYNKVRKNSREVEFELVREEVEEIDALIHHGQSDLDWNSPGKIFII